VEKDNRKVSVARQCELLDLWKYSYYYNSVTDDDYNLELMGLMDEQYTKSPFYGVRRMTAWLRARGYEVNPKRVRKLFQRMGFQAIYPHRRISFSSPGHKIYPYLLEGVKVERPDQVWGADITYIRLAHGFVYLVVVMDWYSRYVLSWELSNTLDSRFCVEALGKALWTSRPEIFNTDQGVQFSSQEFTGLLQDCEIKISMDGRGRATDNARTERFFRSLKYEKLYTMEYYSVGEVKSAIESFVNEYNHERPHQALGYKHPAEVYYEAM